jgi:hypothetical protein
MRTGAGIWTEPHRGEVWAKGNGAQVPRLGEMATERRKTGTFTWRAGDGGTGESSAAIVDSE